MEAAGYLFEEFYRQDILTAEYFLDSKRFLGKIAIQPDQDMHDAFFAAGLRAQDLARLRLEADPDDPNALLAMTLSLGMQADYAALIESTSSNLGMIRDADKFAKKLLAINPDASDAYLTLGAANYIIGSLSALKRFFLKFKGIGGDKRVGIGQLEIAATPAVTCGRLRRFSWRWRRCARRRLRQPAFNLRSSSRSFRRIHSLSAS